MKKNNIKKVLLFGGQGFIGSHVVDNLLSKGYEVTIVDRKLDADKFEEYGWTGKVDFHLGDIKDRDVVMDAVYHCDAIMNLAGLLGTQEMMNNPIPAVEVNIIGAINVFDAIKAHNKRGFQVAVGNFWMNNPYSITKSTAERFALMYNAYKGTDIRVLRMMNVYGERQLHRPIRKIFPNLVIPALLNEDIILYGSGNQVMDMIYAGDVAEVLVRTALTDGVPNNIVFESGAGGITINETAELVLKLTNSKSKIIHTEMRPGEEKDSIVAISEEGWKNLEKYVGYTKDMLTPMEEAISKSISWYKENLDKFPWD
jgi:nucleoside-diphosphate-sugar epimerase